MKKKSWFLTTLSVFLLLVGIGCQSLTKNNLPEIVKKIAPSVVVIITYDDKGEAIGQGSGFFIDKNGEVITNWHVLQGAIKAEVKAVDGKVYPITMIIAEDREGDLIRVSTDIPPSVVSPLFISSSIPEVGERIVVIGSPMGLEKTVSDGIVSAIREIPEFGRIIQITAPISPGSSGSPVVNMKNEVIGVATFQMLEGQNLNFAIPGERVKSLSPSKGQSLAERNEGTAEGLYHKGLSFFGEENYEKALPYFVEAVKKNPIYAEAHFYAGNCYCELGRTNDAIISYYQAVNIKPGFAEALCNLGVAYDKLTLTYSAIKYFEQAIRTKPDLAKAHFNLGMAHLELGNRNSAMEEYKILKDLDNDLANELFNSIYK